MSGETSGEKTELPTPKRERESREKGQVAKSTEVTTTISLFSVISYLWFSWDRNFSKLVALMDDMAGLAARPDFSSSGGEGIYGVFWAFMDIVVPLIGVAIAAGIFGNFVQFGFLWAVDSIMPKLSKISIAEGFKRIFSMKQVVQVLKSMLKIVLLSTMLYFVVKHSIGAYINSLACGIPCIANISGGIMKLILSISFLAFVGVAILDFMFQKHTHIKSLKMTKDEVKREHKESEGSPEIKSQRKRVSQEILMSDNLENTRKASAVVVNPTHYAVAISYRPDEVAVPLVVAKGLDLTAMKMRAEAEGAGVPVFANVKLARMLYAEVDIEELIPQDLFSAVAEILVWIDQNKDKLYNGPLERGVIDLEHEKKSKGEG
ncbi:type III secretion system export apparatus subunit SctU [Pseudovibrio sp. Tun.PSC04-5.I4]|uniref:type III secretion system export apparatus subunit SctU n=1 Tax=Pseudovibrio sp. Tun.PSC04-5.I4 TaxID=1798213 RepID=UPI00088860F4|nr:type III secretion system export apparatus subunit SctU [Pseudovibrio sp. Tun.PSC04-5.I4]SDR14594.1 type III secretion protein U [Pseudovibrio sp. Tun.PSC04-5.I4]